MTNAVERRPAAEPAGASVAVVDTACSNCGAHDDEVLYEGCEHEYEGTTDALFPVVRCRACGLVRLNPRPDVSELGRIYPPDYYAYQAHQHLQDGKIKLGDRIKRAVYQRHFRAVLGRDAAPGRERRAARVLDVGCGDGRLLEWFSQARGVGPVETFGIEMDEAAAEVARRRGHSVVTGRFEVDRELEAGSFDVIFASHVIEHVDDPVAFAARAAELLRPGGLFVVSTPNIDSRDARRLGAAWGGNHFPRHWTFYDPASIGVLAEKVGLRVERIDYELNPIFWVWSAHAWSRNRFPHAGWPDRVFPPVAIFTPSMRSLATLGVFWFVDLAQRAITGRTASMQVELRRPPG
jgi:2-polyprenyl-3-methyl-5-hydroxy-6-metoxy-1,4-benzoquinol methylase